MPQSSQGENWRPSASREVLVERARLFALIRAFFAERDILEVDTPVLSQGAASEPELESYSLLQDVGRRLITSPEFAMKRLLAAGSGSIYRLGPAFREGESGRWHNPEFCMLEWYQVDSDYHALMDDVEALVRALFPEKIPKISRYTVATIFEKAVGLDPHHASIQELQIAAERRQWAPQNALPPALSNSRNYWLDLILAFGIPETLGAVGGCFIYDYPACMASLTATRNENPPVAERFEFYWNGVEIANGGNELRSAKDVKQRFDTDRKQRVERGSNAIVGDDRLVEAQTHGLPQCTGVALGVDRLLAVMLGFDSIDQVISFAWDRA